MNSGNYKLYKFIKLFLIKKNQKCFVVIDFLARDCHQCGGVLDTTLCNKVMNVCSIFGYFTNKTGTYYIPEMLLKVPLNNRIHLSF